MKENLKTVVDTLRRQRVRQGDFRPVLECVVEQAKKLGDLAPSGPIQAEADLMRARAFELQRIASSVPKFVVEDLIDESIERLEALMAGHGAPDAQ
jgi:hypothetical protein